MKVMIVTPYFYPKVGGLENYALNVAKGLQDQGHDVFVVTSNHEGKARVEERVQGLRVIRLSLLVKLSNTPVNLLWRRQLKKIIRIEKPDIINAHSPVPFMADMAFLAKGKSRFILTYHSGSLKKGDSLVDVVLGFYEKAILKSILKRSDAIISVYPDFLEKLLKSRKRLNFIPPGVDTGIFKPQPLHNNKNTILYVGRIERSSEWKGLGTLFEAMRIIVKVEPKARLKLIGDGDAVEDYRQLAEKLGLQNNVTFAGTLYGEQVVDAVQSATTLVLPSETDSEAFGIVLIEAMACGLPVVGSRVGGIPNVIIDGKNGLLVPPKDAKQLATAILKILTDKEYAGRLGKSGVLHAKQNFSLDRLVRDTNILFEKTIRPRVCLIHNMVSPYRLAIFEALSEQVNLTVLFCKPITKDRKWKFDLSKYTFPYSILKGFSVGPIIFNTNAISELLNTRFDVVIANNDPDVAPIVIIALFLAKVRRKRILGWSQVIDANIHFLPTLAYSNKPVNKLLRKCLSAMVMMYRRMCFKASDHFVVLNNGAKVFLEKNHISPDHITRVQQVMPRELLPDPTTGIKRDGCTFLYLGYLNDRKGLGYLIDAFMQIVDKRVRLIIAGTGPIEAQLKKRAQGDRRIKFVGYTEGIDKANLYAGSDVFVLPTLLDVWGLVINEAMYYGLAIVCSDAAEAKDIIDEKAGIIVPVANTEELKNGMQDLLDHPAKMRAMQKHNFHNLSVVDVSLAANGYVEAIKGAML